MPAPATDLLYIERLSCSYIVPRAHPAPESLRSSLDEVARENIDAECARVLSSMVDPNDPSVWVIDRMELALSLDFAGLGKTGAASLWASGVAEKLARIVAAGPDEAAGIRRFPDRAAYLAWLLGGLIAGRPWTPFHSREFEGLRVLPLAGLIAEAVVREPEVAESVLLHILRSGALDSLMRILTPASAMRILHVCAPESDPDSMDRDLWSAAFRLSGRGAAPLAMYLGCREELPGRSASSTRAAAEQILLFRAALEIAAVRAALAAQNFSDALKACRDRDQRMALLALHTLAMGDKEWLSAQSAEVASTIAAAADTLDSPFGGIFLLLPDLIALYPESTALARFVIFLKCAGHDLAPAAWRDPAFLMAAGLEKLPELEEIQSCSFAVEHPENRIPSRDREGAVYANDNESDLGFFSLHRLLPDPETDPALSIAALRLMKQFARRFMGLERSSPAYLWSNLLSGWTTISRTRARITVRLARRPLAILLQMAGLDRFTCLPPWLPETEIVFEIDDD